MTFVFNLIFNKKYHKSMKYLYLPIFQFNGILSTELIYAISLNLYLPIYLLNLSNNWCKRGVSKKSASELASIFWPLWILL